jgi:hypothetical protein
VEERVDETPIKCVHSDGLPTEFGHQWRKSLHIAVALGKQKSLRDDRRHDCFAYTHR